MEEKILDHIEEVEHIQYSSRNVTIAIAKGVAAFVMSLGLTAFYLWCQSNMFAFSSGRAQSVVSSLVVYATLLLGYSVISILLGVKMKENNQKSVSRLEMISTVIQIAIAVLLLLDWWFTFEMRVL